MKKPLPPEVDRWPGDLMLLFLIAATTFGLNVFGLSAVEYVRHTEADRTLIAWGMWETGDYLVPQLIHSDILTKPPLYYWILASTFSFFGQVSEFTARFPSVIISVLFALLQYSMARFLGASKAFALTTTLVLITGFSFFILSAVAEIDMCYGFLCALVFYLSYLSVVRRSAWLTCLAYAMCGVAFLAKGPPVLVFFVLAQLPFFFIHLRSVARPEKAGTILKFIGASFLGLLCFAGVVYAWLGRVATKVGWSELVRQFRAEILDRFVAEMNHHRGAFFYVGSESVSLLPWSPFFFCAAYLWIRKYLKKQALDFSPETPGKLFFTFNLLAYSLAFVILSAADGKSNRYIFPVYALSANLVAYALFAVRDTKVVTVAFKLWQYLAILLAVGFPIASATVRLAAVSSSAMLTTGILLGATFAILAVACKRRKPEMALVAVLAIFGGLRFAQAEVYAPYRNATRTVKPIAAEINALLPEGAVLYNIEVFERWVSYYLKHLGRETWRLTPELSMNPMVSSSGKVYLLLHNEEEGWRIEQLKSASAETKVLKEFQQSRDEFSLLETSPEALKVLEPHPWFPTFPSPPYYMKEKRT